MSTKSFVVGGFESNHLMNELIHTCKHVIAT